MSNAEQNCKWHFAKSLGGQDQGPNDAMKQSFKKDQIKSIVRESIQNSLDAAISKDVPVKVTFRYKNIRQNSYPQIFSIKNHIDGCLDYYPNESARKKFQPMLDYLIQASENKNGMDCLEISDENTTGMEYKEGEDETNNPFYSFVKSAGNSFKPNNTSGGSFGFGKAAYLNMSKINTILVSTKTEHDQYFFEGIASLCTHKIDGQKYVPVGYYCDNDNEKPIKNKENIPTKFQRTEVGTSVFILGLGLEDINEKINTLLSIRQEILLNFWLAILKGKLCIEITFEDTNTIIDSSNVGDFLAISFPEFKDNKRGHNNPRPYFDAVVNAKKSDKNLFFEKNIPVLGKVKLYMRKDKEGSDNILFMRSPLMLVKYGKNGTNYGFHAVFVCSDPIGNRILRDMENPSHSEWDPNNCDNTNDKKNAKEANSAMNDFIQSCIKEAFATEDSTTLLFGGLDEYLSIPSSLDDDDAPYNPSNGKPSGDTTDSVTTSSTTDISGGTIHTKEQPTPGRVTIKTTTSAVKGKTENGTTVYRGNSTIPKQQHGGGIPGSSNPKEAYTETNEGKESVFAEPLSVRYRSYAQLERDEYYHHVIIHSSKDSESAQVTILSSGESSDEELNITYSDKGKPRGNTIKGVKLQKGKNILKVKFEDGMRHAIKVNFNENK